MAAHAARCLFHRSVRIPVGLKVLPAGVDQADDDTRRYTDVEIMQIEKLRDVIEGFAEVCLAYVFGSVADGTARADSDLDVAALRAPNSSTAVLDRLAEALESASGRTVDLVDLSLAPPLLIHEIIKNGTLIINRDRDEGIAFVTRAIARYLDTAHLRKVQHQYLRERVEARDGAQP